MSQRTEKVNSLLQEKIAEIIQKELSLKPSVFVSISKVDTSPDLRYAKVFLSVYPVTESNYIEKTFQKEIHRIQKALNAKLHMKILPKIVFQLE
ncbi:MAG: ribosome-binding factor A, partial [Patescibacteria group bacterium]|nr:ribosome-binding factor A [Patescibacteria group bacterium]